MTSSPLFSDPTPHPQHIAGIDLGTNTLRLLIARVDSDECLVAVYSDQVITRLGQGLQQDGRLQDSAMDRTISQLKAWSAPLLRHDIRQPVAVATSAVREAENRDEFLQRVRTQVGIELEVLSGPEEARRTLVGITAGLTPPLPNILVIDIGGGSTEFISVRDEKPVQMSSTDLGVVRITERYLTSNPILPHEITTAQRFIVDRLESVNARHGQTSNAILVGTAGTITTLAAMDQALEPYDPRKIHQSRLSLAIIQEMKQACIAKTIAERQTIPGLEHGRADVIVAGILILQLTMETLGFSSLIVSEYGLREGILVNQMQHNTGNVVSLDLF